MFRFGISVSFPYFGFVSVNQGTGHQQIQKHSSVTFILQWESLESGRIKHRLAIMFKMILHDLIVIPPDKYITPASTKTHSKHEQKLRQVQTFSD